MFKDIKSLYMRNLLTVITALVISHLLMGVVFFAFYYNGVPRDRKAELAATAVEVSRMVSAYSMSWELDGLDMRVALTSYAEATGFDLILCDTSGKCVSCSDRQFDCRHIGKSVSPYTLKAIDSFADDASLEGKGELGGVLEKRQYYIGRPIRDFVKGNTIGYVFLLLNAAALGNMWQEFAVLYLMVGAVVIIIAFNITRYVTKMQTQPIDEMARAANRFAHGDFSVRVSAQGRKDEIGELAGAFNVMAESLEKSETRRREFVSNVSHELKTPMTTITGFAEGILDGTIPPSQQREYLEMISSESKRLSRLVRGMLDASMVQEADRESILSKTFDIVETVSLALLSLEKKITDRGLDVNVLMPEDALLVRGDSDTITQVVYNLLDNAAKFASPGSALELEVWKERNKVYVSVENEGDTIPESEITEIFDRFHKTDKSRSKDKDGVGLGLYIVKTILDRHGEDIFVKSADGKTTFTFSLTAVI